MRITLTDTNSARGNRILERLSGLPGITVNERCYGLTDAFNSIEHRPPHIVIYSEDLTQLPEFNAMESLCNCLSVRWMVLGHARRVNKPGVLVLDPEAADGVILNAISNCMKSKPYQAPRASAGLFRSSKGVSSNGIVLIGSSTGGIDALLSVLGSFPINCPPTIVVQHTGAGFSAGLARVLDQRVEPLVREARHGETPSEGSVLIAPGSETHLRLGGSSPISCQLEKGARVSGHCPSVDALFTSAVPIAKRVTAAILTGMGRDGAQGLLSLRQAGARTISQDEATSVVYGMPREAVKLGAAEQILPLPQIGPALLRASQMKATA